MPEPDPAKDEAKPTSPETAETAEGEQHDVAEKMAEEPDLPV